MSSERIEIHFSEIFDDDQTATIKGKTKSRTKRGAAPKHNLISPLSQ